jgi:hypothetical protein
VGQYELDESPGNEPFSSVLFMKEVVITLPPYIDLDRATRDQWDK